MHIKKLFIYKHLFFFSIGIIIAILLTITEWFQLFINWILGYKFFAALLGGVLFVFTFTVATGAVLLLSMSEIMHPGIVALIGGLGALLGDLVIFQVSRKSAKKFVENNAEQKGLFQKILSIWYIQMILPFIGALIIASPFPDEIGVSLMGISNISRKKFMILSFVLNTLGIFAIIEIGLLAIR